MKKLQVFVSSTYLDLIEERQRAVQGILRAGHIPAGMELFKAGNKKQWQVIEEWIKESDVLMIILGGKYGSVEPESGKSYTQLEYEFAMKQGIPVFGIVLNEQYLANKKSNNIQLAIYEREVASPEVDKYNSFKRTVESNLVTFISEIFEITSEVSFSLNEFMKTDLTEYHFKGWIRGTDVIDEQRDRKEIMTPEVKVLNDEPATLKPIIDEGGVGEERVVWLLPRGFLLFTDITFENNDSWSVVANYYDYDGNWMHGTHFHSSYSRSWEDRLEVQYNKLSIPESDWRWGYEPLNFLTELRLVTQAIDIQKRVEGKRKLGRAVFYYEPGEPIFLPEVPFEYESLNKSGNIRDFIFELSDENRISRLSNDELIQMALTIRQGVFLECLSYLGEDNPSLKFISEIVDDFNKSFSSDEVLIWFKRLGNVLQNTLYYQQK